MFAARIALCLLPLCAGLEAQQPAPPGQDTAIDVICPRNVALVHVLVSITPTGLERARFIRHPLADAARERFAPFAEHPAVAFTEQLFRRMSYHPMNYTALLHSEFPEGARVRRLPDYMTPDPETAAALDRYAGLVRDFHEASGFDGFWTAHASRVRGILDTARSNLREPGLPGIMEALYGREAGRFFLVVSPFMQESGFHVELAEDGALDFYAFTGGSTYANELSLNSIAFHELSHGFIEPMSLQHTARIQALSHLYRPLEERFRSLGYPDWDRAFNEHMVTAGQLHLTRMVFGRDTALAMLEREEARGFRLIDRFYRLFDRYLAARDRYPDLESFYPVILDELERLRVEEGRAPGSMGFYPRFEEDGVVVLRLLDGSAFERAGVEPGDRITAIAGEPVGPEAVFDAVKARHWAGAREGETVPVTVSRDGRTLHFEVPVPFVTRLEYVEGDGEAFG